jgi:uncharacterized protein (DUF1697 family)
MASTSATYLALLRGVNNIGKATRVSMADLRTLFERLGFRDVRTLLNSGNVVFSAPKTGRAEVHARIEAALAEMMQRSVPVIVLSAREIAAVVRDNLLAHVASNPSRLLVIVPRSRSGLTRLRPLLKQRWAPEALAIGSRVAYVWCANGVANSPVWTAVDRALDRSGTARNIATFTKARALVEARGP